jgi:diguanylate cyclase (GGDEF)-like protein
MKSWLSKVTTNKPIMMAGGGFLCAWVLSAFFDLNHLWVGHLNGLSVLGLDDLPIALSLSLIVLAIFGYRYRSHLNETANTLSDTIEQLEHEIEERKHAEEMAELLSATKNEVLHRETERSEQLELITRMGDYMASVSSLDELKQISTRFLRKLLPSHTVGVLFTDQHFSKWTLEDAWGDRQELIHREFETNDCWVLRRGQPYIDHSNTHSMTCNHANNQHVKSVACYPIFCRNFQFGVLHLRSEVEQVPLLTPEEEKLVVGVCNTIGLHFYNAKLRAELSLASSRDELTGLLNRRGLGNTLKREIHASSNQGYHVSVAMMDIDHFKQYNDSYGHPEGDKALRFVAEQLTKHLRARDVIARYGGEEFIVILPNTRKAEAFKKLKSLLEVIHKASAASPDCQRPITLSVGLATSPEDQTDEERLIKLADMALYGAKKRGRNCVVPYLNPANVQEKGAAKRTVARAQEEQQ